MFRFPNTLPRWVVPVPAGLSLGKGPTTFGKRRGQAGWCVRETALRSGDGACNVAGRDGKFKGRRAAVRGGVTTRTAEPSSSPYSLHRDNKVAIGSIRPHHVRLRGSGSDVFSDSLLPWSWRLPRRSSRASRSGPMVVGGLRGCPWIGVANGVGACVAGHGPATDNRLC